MLAIVLATLAKHNVIFKPRLREISKRITAPVFKNLHSNTICFDLHNCLSFKIIDKGNSKFYLQIKEALHINWKKPSLNAQQNHIALTLSV